MLAESAQESTTLEYYPLPGVQLPLEKASKLLPQVVHTLSKHHQAFNPGICIAALDGKAREFACETVPPVMEALVSLFVLLDSKSSRSCIFHFDQKHSVALLPSI